MQQLTEDAETSMNTNWQQGSNQQQYTLTSGACRAVVWYQATGEWAALITQGTTAINNGTFRTLMDTQTWCEDRLAELQAKT
jgi:hypothetical protein